MIYPLSPQGVFWTVQGEGMHAGRPEVFIRLAGCNVNCPECDTDYSVAERASVKEIARRVCEQSNTAEWVWLTGGEPLIHDLLPLIAELRRLGFRIAIATSGSIKLDCYGKCAGGPDFLSVSPHFMDDRWEQRSGDQLNIVIGLNGLDISDLNCDLLRECNFSRKYVTPCDGKSETFAMCVDWVKTHRGWSLGSQQHKTWGIR